MAREEDKAARAEWQRLVVDMLQQEPPLTLQEWQRQLAVEYVLARVLFHLKERGSVMLPAQRAAALRGRS